MGIIQKQSSRSVIILTLSFAIGAINLLFLYKTFFTKDEVGLTRVLLDVTVLLSSFAALGAPSIIIKFFPFYRDYTKPKQNDLFFITGLLTLMGFGLMCVLVHTNQHLIIKKYSANAPLLVNYFYLVYGYCFFYIVYGWLEAIAWSHKITTTSNLLRELVVRLSTTVFILLYALHVVNFKVFLWLISLSYALPCIILAYIITKRYGLPLVASISSVTKRINKRMRNFGMFVLLGLMFGALGRVFDSIFLASNNGLADTFIFTIAAYFAAVLEIPQRSIVNISTPVLADCWKEHNIKNIQDIYAKSSVTLLLCGCVIFGLLWINVNNLIAYLGPDYASIKYALLFLLLTKVVDMSTGVNGQIIITSNLYKYDFYFSILLTVIMIVSSYFLIKSYGLLGAAISNLITFSIYNIVRCVFLYYHYKLQPFTSNSLVVVGCCTVSIAITYLLPTFSIFYVDAFIRTALYLVVLLPVIYVVNPVPHVKALVLGYLSKR